VTIKKPITLVRRPELADWPKRRVSFTHNASLENDEAMVPQGGKERLLVAEITDAQYSFLRREHMV
jgi:hypothetical protein